MNHGGGCSRPNRSPSLHFGQVQGDFRKMQGGGRHNVAKRQKISIAWNGVSLLKRAGRSREAIVSEQGKVSLTRRAVAKLQPDIGS